MKENYATKNIMINNISALFAEPNDEYDKIIIYSHGLGSDKEIASRFFKYLVPKKYAVVSFNYPGHGDDKTDLFKFDIKLCLEYLNIVIKYVEENFSKKQIILFGSSFGGYVILNKLLTDICDYKIVLMNPAINFGNIVRIKANVTDDYFFNNNNIELFNGICLSKQAYLDLLERDKLILEYKYNNILVIQGTADTTVISEDIIAFCIANNLILKLIKDGKHELYGHSKEIVKYIIENK